ncbi:CMD domain-containing protein [Halomonas dongshanensis]|uniref:CMD domain protein n=1 Tax=Halomonas dongshanensis TaxID=2890835 RepID=A0ABT2EGP4_9GAMM|nr:hypothetical protein [Halomonas dongshanensis]MCS2610710.1 hypothetical protein [Halomonas dongshanensis]
MTHVIETAAHVPQSGPLADALAMRGKLMALTQDSHDAALTPSDPGGVPLALRAALACRMARICHQAGLEKHYATLLSSYGDEHIALLADPEVIPETSEPRLAAIVAYVDLVTRSPKEATKADIGALRQAEVEEADIVRLAGLVAFTNYQLRVTAVLSVMGEAK